MNDFWIVLGVTVFYLAIVFWICKHAHSGGSEE